MMKAMLKIFIVIGFGIPSALASAEEKAMFVRIKSGVNFPQGNTIVNHLVPGALDFGYRISHQWSVGVELISSTGSASFQSYDASTYPTRTEVFTTSRFQILTLGVGEYVFHYGNARIHAGIKAGFMYARADSSATEGAGSIDVPQSSSERRFAFGPAVSIDLPIQGALFLDVGGDTMLVVNNSQNSFESLYVGLGWDF
jgi:hypothetical protein